MKIIKVLLKILLPIFLILLTMSFIVKDVAVKTISKEITSKKISEYILDEVSYDLDINELESIKNEIRGSKYIEDITDSYIDALSSNILNNEHKKIDITKEINLIINSDLKGKLTTDQVNYINDYVMDRSELLQSGLEESLSYSLGTNTYTLLKLYRVLTSIIFRVIITLLVIIDITGLVLLEKFRSLKSIYIGVIITSLMSLMFYIIIKLLSNFIEQRLSGGWIDNINLNILITFIVIEFIIGIGLFIINKTIDSPLRG